MDLGIAGKRTIVGAASKGLGKGCAMALAEEGVHLVINARTASELEATAEEIRSATGVEVKAVAGDITLPGIRQAILAACPEPDILVTNAGGPAPGNFRTDTRERWLAALEAQLLGHAEMITAMVDGMAERGFGRIVNITSQSTKMPVPNLGLSTSARLALQGFCNTICREVVDRNVVINNLLAGPVRHRPAAERHRPCSKAGRHRRRRQRARSAWPRRRPGASARRRSSARSALSSAASMSAS